MRNLLFVLAVIPFAAQAAEPKATQAGCGDVQGRLAVIHYKPLTIYECYLSPDVATAIIAAGDEVVGPAGQGDPEGLELRKTNNMVLVQPKPSEVNRAPNVVFETKTRDGVIRPYYFIFHVSGLPVGVAAIQLVYDDAPIPGLPAQSANVAPQREKEQVYSTLKTAVYYGGTNWDYDCMCDGGRELIPDISDNGQDTIIDYKGSTPAHIVIARLYRDGTEKPDDLPHGETVVNFTPLATGAPFVITEVAQYWSIRSDKQVIAMRNNRYHPELVDQRTGTQSPYVVRKVKPTPVPKQAPVQRTASQ